MKKKSLVSVLGVLAVLCTGAGVFSACAGDPLTLPPYDYDYSKPAADFGDGIQIDGKLDDEIWQGQRVFSTTIRNTNVVYSMTSYFGEKGAYFAFDIDDDAVYYNAEREIWANSGIEFCVGSPENTSITYEIDLNAGGKRMLRKYTGQPYTDWFSNLYSAVTTKGGDVNTTDCTGYSAEIYLPYSLFNADGSDTPLDYLLVNPSIIRASSVTSSDDRLWYCIGMEERALGYAPASMNWYNFGATGLICDDVTITCSSGGTVTGKDYILKGDSYVLNIAPDAGYYLDRLLVNGRDVTDALSYADGKAVFKFSGSGEAVIDARFAPLSSQKHTLSGTVSAADAGTLENVLMFAAFGGTVTPVEVKADGSYTVSLPEAEYELYCSADGYLTNVEQVNLYGDSGKDVTLRKSFLGRHPVIGSASDASSWDFSMLGQGTAVSNDNGWLVAANHTELMGKKLFASGDIVLPMRDGTDRRAGFRFVDESGNGVYVCLLAENETNADRYQVQVITLRNGTSADWVYGASVESPALRALANGSGVPLAVFYENGKISLWVNGAKIFGAFGDGFPIGADSEVVPGIATCSGGEFRNLTFNTEGYGDGYPVSISVDGRGTVSCDKTTYAAGDTLIFTVTPREGYAVDSILVNGEDAFSALNGNTFTVETGNLTSITVAVSFVPVEGEKGTVSGTVVCGGAPVTDEITLTFSNKATGEEIKVKSEGGTFSFGEVAPGVWELTAGGGSYLDYKQIFNISGNTQITVELSVVTMRDKWIAADGEWYDVDEIEQGKIVYTGTEGSGSESYGVTLNLTVKASEDAYVSAVIRKQDTFVTDDAGGIRYGFRFVGAGRSLNFDYAYWGTHNISLVDWGVIDQSAQFSAKQLAAYEGDGLRIAAARINGRFYLFAEEDGVMKLMASGEHEALSNAQFQIGFETWWQARKAEYKDFDCIIGSSIPLDVVKTGGENGSMEVSANPVLGGSVTVTLTPDDGYVLYAFTVNGQNAITSLTEDDGSYVYTLNNYTATKDLAFHAEFIEQAEVSVSLDIRLHKYAIGADNLASIPDGVAVVLRGAANTYEGVSADGGITFSKVERGTYKVEVSGYVGYEISIDAATDTQVVLEYDLIGSSDNIDTSDANNGNVTVNVGAYEDVYFTQTVQADEDFYVSAVFTNVDPHTANNLRFGFFAGWDANGDGSIDDVWGDGRTEKICAQICYAKENTSSYYVELIPTWQNYPLGADAIAAMENGDGVRLGFARVDGRFFLFREMAGSVKLLIQWNGFNNLNNQMLRVGVNTMGGGEYKTANYSELQFVTKAKTEVFEDGKLADAFTKLNADVMAVTDSGTGFKAIDSYKGLIMADLSRFGEQDGALNWSTQECAEIVYFKNAMTNFTLDFTVKGTIPANGRITALSVYTGIGPFVCDITNISDDNYTLRMERHWDDWNDGVSLTAKQLQALKTTGLRMRIVRSDLKIEWYVDTCEGETADLQLAVSRDWGDNTNYTFGATGCGMGVSGSAAEFTGITLSDVS